MISGSGFLGSVAMTLAFQQQFTVRLSGRQLLVDWQVPVELCLARVVGNRNDNRD
jgi:hypothetical protein